MRNRILFILGASITILAIELGLNYETAKGAGLTDGTWNEVCRDKVIGRLSTKIIVHKGMMKTITLGHAYEDEKCTKPLSRGVTVSSLSEVNDFSFEKKYLEITGEIIQPIAVSLANSIDLGGYKNWKLHKSKRLGDKPISALTYDRTPKVGSVEAVNYRISPEGDLIIISAKERPGSPWKNTPDRIFKKELRK